MVIHFKIILSGLLAVMFITAKSQVVTDSTAKRQKQLTYALGIKYNDFAIARSSLYDLIAMEPQNDSLLFNLAYLYFDTRQYASSVLVCIDVLARNPNNLGALEISAFSYENLGLKDRALENYEKIYRQNINDANILYKMAFLQYELKRFNESKINVEILLNNTKIDELKQVFNFDQVEQKEFVMRVPILNLKGLVYKELGDIETAKSSFEEALTLAPDFKLAKENLDALN